MVYPIGRGQPEQVPNVQQVIGKKQELPQKMTIGHEDPKQLEMLKNIAFSFLAQPQSEDDLFIQEDLDSLKTIPCIDGWTYNLTGLFKSAVTEASESVLNLTSVLMPISQKQFDWVCEDDWKGPFTQSVAYFGAVFGGIIFGFISDYYGRFDHVAQKVAV